MMEREQSAKELHQIKLILAFMAAVTGVIILRELHTIFIPLALALLLSFVFAGPVEWLVRHRCPRGVALAGVLAFLFVLAYAFGLMIYSGVSAFVRQFPSYAAKLGAVMQAFSARMKMPLPNMQQVLDQLDWTQSLNTLSGLLGATFGSFTSFVGYAALVLIFLMFMLGGRTVYMERLDQAVSAREASRFRETLQSIEGQVRRYLVIKTLISLLTAGLAAVVLLLGQADFLVFSCLLIFLLNFIPNVGSVVATLFPVLLATLKFGFQPRVLVLTLALMSIQFLVGNVLEPRVAGQNLNLSPLVILVSLILWGWIWGVVGMILAVPLTSALRIWMSGVPALHPLATLISGGRPARTRTGG